MSLFSRRGSAAAPELPYDPRSPQGLAARWVQWVAAAPAARNPVADATGEDAAANQPADVWFLAGSYGDVVRRQCVVPAGRELFVPVFNLWDRDGGPPPVVDGAYGSLVVDGVSLEPEAIGTPAPFTVAGAALNGVTLRRKPKQVTVWGLWKLVPGLPAGDHDLHVVGGDGHGFTVDVAYRLSASPAGAGPLLWPAAPAG